MKVGWSLAYETWFYVLGGALAACVALGRGPIDRLTGQPVPRCGR